MLLLAALDEDVDESEFEQAAKTAVDAARRATLLRSVCIIFFLQENRDNTLAGCKRFPNVSILYTYAQTFASISIKNFDKIFLPAL